LTEKDKDKILIIPCSGIGKPGGTIARLAMYYIVEDLCPEETDTLCLPLLVIGDEETKKRVQRSPTIAIDGCPSRCASKNIQLSGGILSASLNVLRIYRDHLDLEVKSVANPGPGGEKFARIVAGKILKEIEKIKRERDVKIKVSGNSSM
jgi:uncharacterized metal-binding protein